MKSTSRVVLGLACTTLLGCSTTVTNVDGGGTARDAVASDRFVLGDQENCGNGLDDDRDGEADENCMCPTAGITQRCTLAASFAVGCAEGTQTCTASGEFATWGPCSERSTVCAFDASTTPDASMPVDAFQASDAFERPDAFVPDEDTGPPINDELRNYCRMLVPATDNQYVLFAQCETERGDARTLCGADPRCGLAEYVHSGDGYSCRSGGDNTGLRQWVCVPVSSVPSGMRLIGP